MGEEVLQNEEVSSEGQGLKPFSKKATAILQKLLNKKYKEHVSHPVNIATAKWYEFLFRNAIVRSNPHFFEFLYAASAAGIMTSDEAKDFVLVKNPVTGDCLTHLLVPREFAEKAVVMGYIPHE